MSNTINNASEKSEECTRLAVCVFIGHDPRSWIVEAHEFAIDCELEALDKAAEERERQAKQGGPPRVVVLARRFTRIIGSTRRSEWRVDRHVIVESEDFNVRALLI